MNRTKASLSRRTINVLAYFLSGSVPRNSRCLVFGAWHGNRYADNSKYLFEFLAARHENLDLVWCGRESLRDEIVDAPNVRFVPYGSWRALWACLRASVCFVSHGTADLSPFPVFHRCRRVYLGHGIAIKNMGAERENAAPTLQFVRSIWRRANSFDHWASSSPAHTTKLLDENQLALVRRAQIAPCGQPRLDPLFESRSNSHVKMAIREKLERKYGLPVDAKLISYLPTFRDSGEPAFSFGALDADALAAIKRILDPHEAWIAEKSHLAQTVSRTGRAGFTRYINLSSESDLDTQELLIATDILVTDYSGCYIDFLILDRPIIHFAYDHETYISADRGLYFSLDDVSGGDIVTACDELLQAIAHALADPSNGHETRQRLQSRLLTWERGNSRSRASELAGLNLTDGESADVSRHRGAANSSA